MYLQMNNFIGKPTRGHGSIYAYLTKSLYHVVGQVTPTMLTNIGFGTFVFFGVSYVRHPAGYSTHDFHFQAFTFVGGLFVMFFVPETKGLTLEEMDEVFGTVGLAAADTQRLADINKRIGLDAYDFDETNEKRDADSDVKEKSEA